MDTNVSIEGPLLGLNGDETSSTRHKGAGEDVLQDSKHEISLSKANHDSPPDELQQRLSKLEKQIAILLQTRSTGTEQNPTAITGEIRANKKDGPGGEAESSKQGLHLPTSDQVQHEPHAVFINLNDYENRPYGLEQYPAIDIVTSSRFTVTQKTLQNFDVRDLIDPPAPGEWDANFLENLIFIQINCPSLRKVLSHLVDGKTGPEDSIILTPFVSLCHEEANLRDYLRKLSNNSGLDRSSENSKNSWDDQAFRSLVCLISFYDQYVRPWYLDMRGSKLSNVCYGDLLALYQPDDLVYIPDNPQQVYRVMKVSGGRPTMIQLYSKSFDGSKMTNTGEALKRTEKRTEKPALPIYDRNSWHTIVLDCFHVISDGKMHGASFKRFEISFFSGHKDIQMLRPYPFRFAPSHSQESCLAVSQKFLDMTASLPGSVPILYRYTGRTLTKLPDGRVITEAGVAVEEDKLDMYYSRTRVEDIDEEIIVDLDTTFLHRPGWFQWQRDFGKSVSEPDFTSECDTSLLPSTSHILDENVQPHYWFLDRMSHEFYLNNQWLQNLDASVSVWDDEARRKLLATGSDKLLLPNRVAGYILQTRSWAYFDLSDEASWCRVEKNQRSWEQLQIPKGHRYTLSSLVERHFTRNEAARGRCLDEGSENFDFIEGKGKGLIVLLHGAPGVGKTSTAESIAKRYGRALMPISCGNLGTYAADVELQLRKDLRLAEIWNCVVLLDEADVFLARRATKDLYRNALVSVFLRALEYYKGILFLTTNRTGDFDEAFRSRIHVSLFYPDLDLETTKNIWRVHLKLLSENDKQNGYPRAIELNAEKILSFAANHWRAYRNILQRSPWNGRQIRNAFQTAVALADFAEQERVKVTIRENDSISDTTETSDIPHVRGELKWEHFKDVAVYSNKFELYLLRTRGITDEERADEDYLRARETPFGDMPFDVGADGKPRKRLKVNSHLASKLIENLSPDQEPTPLDGLYEAEEEPSPAVNRGAVPNIFAQHPAGLAVAPPGFATHSQIPFGTFQGQQFAGLYGHAGVPTAPVAMHLPGAEYGMQPATNTMRSNYTMPNNAAYLPYQHVPTSMQAHGQQDQPAQAFALPQMYGHPEKPTQAQATQTVDSAPQTTSQPIVPQVVIPGTTTSSTGQQFHQVAPQGHSQFQPQGPYYPGSNVPPYIPGPSA